MNANIEHPTIILDVRCVHCAKKLAEIHPPAILTTIKIKCSRCGNMTDSFEIKEKETKPNHKPQEQPEYKPVKETKPEIPKKLLPDENYFVLEKK